MNELIPLSDSPAVTKGIFPFSLSSILSLRPLSVKENISEMKNPPYSTSFK